MILALVCLFLRVSFLLRRASLAVSASYDSGTFECVQQVLSFGFSEEQKPMGARACTCLEKYIFPAKNEYMFAFDHARAVHSQVHIPEALDGWRLVRGTIVPVVACEPTLMHTIIDCTLTVQPSNGVCPTRAPQQGVQNHRYQ